MMQAVILAGGLGARLGDASAASAFNFGPSEEDARPAGWIVERMPGAWRAFCGWNRPDTPGPHEAALLRLDSGKARATLGRAPKRRLNEALTIMAHLYEYVVSGGDARSISLQQIDDFARRSPA